MFLKTTLIYIERKKRVDLNSLQKVMKLYLLKMFYKVNLKIEIEFNDLL